MLVQLSTPLLASLLLATTYAAPTRTHCRCSIISDAPSSATYTPSSAHWSPASPSSSQIATVDICASLGPELERIQHTKSELYISYIRSTQAFPIDDEQRPLPTSVLMDFSSRKGSNNEESEEAPEPTSQAQQRIVCYSEPELFSAFQSSVVNLWTLHIIVAVLVFVCVAEGVYLGMRWYADPDMKPSEQVLTVYRMDKRSKALDAQPISEQSRLRLLGGEKLLLAVPTGLNTNPICSPGAEKKLRAYETTRYFVTQTPSGRREFIAYDDDSDDESNRPVM